MKLDGKVALITGAASGIGHAIAKRYVEAGGRVAIADLNMDGAAAAAKELGGEKTAIGVAMDVSNEDQVNAGVEKARQRSAPSTSWSRMPASRSSIRSRSFPFAAWKKLLAIHLDGAFLTTKACVKHMYKQNSGALIYMGSVHSHEASPLEVGLRGGQARHPGPGAHHGQGRRQAQRARQRHLPRLRADAARRKADPRAGKELGISEDRVVKEIMLGETVDKQFTTVEDVAEVALMLAAFKTNALTGQSIVVSHGWHMS